ncbi:MAG: hypothetical protein ING03_02410 [Roseomonas sp.]|nr:hypothetical protein [Roseomonas sp.]MCA3316240.1 hypothetical protein [Roseomonas sp.]MCA3318758.1 hypothetical protein [Roseomonas sp.]
MKLDFRPDGRPIPILEVGDLVRLTRAEAGPAPAAQAGEWGKIRSITERGSLDITLAGYSRPRGVALALVSDFPATNVIPCDHRGVALELPTWSNSNKNETSGFGIRKMRS